MGSEDPERTEGQNQSWSKEDKNFGEKIKAVFRKITTKIGEFFKSFGKDKEGAGKKDESEGEQLPELFVPETTEDLVWFLKRVPREVLTDKERQVLASSMTFSDTRVRELMIPRENITFVHENDFMGPLMLDQLYKSGLSHFPVLSNRGEVIGVLHTKLLNSLEIKETDRASSFIDPNVYYMKDTYTLQEALNAFLRTGSNFFIVVNDNSVLVGIFTLKMLLQHLTGEIPEDDFVNDKDCFAVAKR